MRLLDELISLFAEWLLLAYTWLFGGDDAVEAMLEILNGEMEATCAPIG